MPRRVTARWWLETFLTLPWDDDAPPAAFVMLIHEGQRPPRRGWLRTCAVGNVDAWLRFVEHPRRPSYRRPESWLEALT